MRISNHLRGRKEQAMAMVLLSGVYNEVTDTAKLKELP
jgi:hypothetical protein